MKGLLGFVVAASAAFAASQASAQVVNNGSTVVFTPQAASSNRSSLNIANAKAMPMPMATTAPTNLSASTQSLGPAGFSPGSAGTGKTSLVQVLPAMSEAQLKAAIMSEAGISPQAYGTGNIPYTTSRVNAYNQPTSQYYPFSPTGKLYFNIGSDSYVCTASLIKPGLLVTAAHCVANFGKSQFYTNHTWYPAFNNNSAPYGSWTAKSLRVITSYYDGTDSCYQSGVICTNDVALIELYTPNGLPGTTTGYYGYFYGNYPFTSSNQVHLTQLGYPVALDSGVFMERSDSQGYINSTYSNNTLWGSLQTGGSSGGPLLVNLGRPPLLNGVSYGSASDGNAIIGVTGWGFNDKAMKVQGASPFTSTNIKKLIDDQCVVSPGKC